MTCPVCGNIITENMDHCHRMVGGKICKVHRACYDEKGDECA